MRGFLIHPFLVDIAQLAASETRADPDGAGALTSGYDDDFREPVAYDQPNATGNVVTRQTTRKENLISAPAQVDSGVFEALQMLRSGKSPSSSVDLTFHVCSLQQLGLIDPDTGLTTIKIGDRLVAIRECKTGELVQTVPTPPGLYVTEVRPSGFMGGGRNLFIVTFEERERGQE